MKKDREPQEVEFEVLPPETQESRQADMISRVIAKVMDNLVTVPGTNFKVGLDPILGLLPGVGDGSTALISMTVILQGAALGVPKIILARMALNVFINTAGGAIPGIGDVFSAWYKSNARNHSLLKQYSAGRKQKSTKGDWAFVIGLLVALALGVSLIIFLIFTMLGALFSAIRG